MRSTRDEIKKEFSYYLSNVARSARRTSDGFNLGKTAVGSFLSFIEANKLFDYAPEKWSHIQSLYDITDPDEVKKIADLLLSDSAFLKRDSVNNQGWRSGALSHYACFINARSYFLRLREDSNKQEKITNQSLQQIFYGAPGTGKSHEIKVQTQGDDTVIRTTFHPDSDYSTFVGCYKPTKESMCTLSLHKLHAIYPAFKSKAIDRPLHRFIAKYHDSFRLLTVKEAELVFDKYETPSTISAETPKIMSAIEEIPSTQTITYSFVKQAFTKAYVQAWEKMCRTIPSATLTATIPTGSAISPYFQTGKIGLSNEFIYDPKVALSDEEKELLLKVDNFDFPFEEIDNLAELHNNGITIVVTDKPQDNDKRYHKEITFTAKDIRELYALWESDKERYGYFQGLLWKIYIKLKEEGKIGKEDGIDKLKDYTGESVTIEVNESHRLLGKYVPSTRTVYLYKGNIGNDLNLLAGVYIHEMFHAYFDMVPHQTISEIEEPIVECCTLCFLELFDNAICDDYLKDVEWKQQSSAICYYGFGAYLYENRSLDWMKLYQNGVGKINSYIVNQYRNKFFPAYPFAEEQETMDILYSILNPQSKVVFDKSAQFLIIEEINRGNCAQIFGDLFQLLDRNDYGYSEYPIVPDDDLKNALAEDFAGLTLDVEDKSRIDAIFSENYPAGITDKVLSGELLVLPENLYIWATMNTSDQSLFPIDSAFKRRWDWKYIKITEGKDKDTKKPLRWKILVNDAQDNKVRAYDWWRFLQRMNDIIYTATESADKQMGYFFAKATKHFEGTKVGEIGKDGKLIEKDPVTMQMDYVTVDTFVNKVLFYLWTDILKDNEYTEIIELMKKDGKQLRFPEFFNEAGESINSDALKTFLDNVMKEEEVLCEVMEKMMADEETDDGLSEQDLKENGGKRNFTKVTFSDGTVIDEGDRFATYVAALKKFGLEKSAEIGETSKLHRHKLPLICKNAQQTPPPPYSYVMVDGVYIMKGTNSMHRMLIKIGKELNVSFRLD